MVFFSSVVPAGRSVFLARLAGGGHCDVIRVLGGEVITERVVWSYSPTQGYVVYDVRVRDSPRTGIDS